MPISGHISVAGVPRVPIQGADSAPVFRGEASATPAAAPAATGSEAAPAQADPIAKLQAEATAAAEQRKAAARERAARAAEIKARDAELVRREEALKNIDARLRSYRTNPRAALADLAEFGLTFEDLAQAVVQGDTPEQRALAELRLELDQVKSGAADAERRRTERETRERTTQAETESRARREFIADLGRTATGDPAKYRLTGHFGPAALERGWEVAEDLLRQTGEIPTSEAVLEALERDLQKEVEAAWSAKAGQRPQPRLSPGAAPSSRSPGVRELEADRRARFLGHLGELLRKVK